MAPVVSLMADSRLQRPGRHELRHQDGAFVSPQRALPGVEESDDVGMLQSLQHLHLLSEPLTLRLGQTMSLRISEHIDWFVEPELMNT